MRFNFDLAATMAVSLAAIGVGVAAVHREFQHNARIVAVGDKPSYIGNWRDLGRRGILVGDSAARVTVTEFADLECPYCKRFHSAFEELRRKRGQDVALVYIHFPIAAHRFARPAARASECALAQGRFGAFQDAIYGKQDSLGLKPWSSYAVDAGVADTVAFNRCARDTARVARVEDGLAVGRSIGVQGTPTIIINGWRFAIPPYDSLSTIADRLLDGLDPSGAPLAHGRF